MSEIHRRKATTFLVTALVILTLSLGGTAKAHAATSVVTFTSPNPTGSGHFGSSVAVNRTSVVVGAPGEVAGGVAAGHAYVFGSAGALIATLTSPNPTGSGGFGSSVAMNGTSVVVGAPGETASGSFQAGNAYLFKPTSTATVVFDASTNMAWSGAETTGASAYDTATVTGIPGFTPTGTVVYSFWTNGACSGTPTTTQTVTLDPSGNVPNSASTSPLVAGSYSFNATYSGDSNYMGSTSACEPFSVIKSATSTATVVFDASTNMAWSGAETTGASAYDTASVTGFRGFTPTGSVTYTFYTSGDCSGSGTTESPPGGSSLSGGLVPNSITVGPLVAASYSFRAVYSGDSNYVGSTSACERFIVNKATTTTETALSTSAGVSIPVGGTVPKGTSVNDTATVTSVSGIVPTGSVTYIFYTNTRCSGSGTAQTATMSGGLVPNSTATGPLAANSYSFEATYSGDNNYLSSTSSCEPFNVGLTSFVSTQFFTSANILIPNGESNGSVLNGTSVYDTTTVTGVNGVTPTGTLTYTFFAGNGCIGFGRDGCPREQADTSRPLNWPCLRDIDRGHSDGLELSETAWADCEQVRNRRASKENILVTSRKEERGSS